MCVGNTAIASKENEYSYSLLSLTLHRTFYVTEANPALRTGLLEAG